MDVKGLALKGKVGLDKASDAIRRYLPLLIVGLCVYFFRKTIFGWFGLVYKEDKDAVFDYNVAPGITSMTVAQATFYADKLFKAMDGYDSDNAAIRSVYDAVAGDVAGLALISKAYGVREMKTGLFGFLGASFTGNLEDSLKHDLGSSNFHPWFVLFEKLRGR